MIRFSLAFLLFFLAGNSLADEYTSDLGDLMAEAERNPLTSDGTWFEMLNVMNEWEKVMLIFGYANDYTACESILNFASAQNPNRLFRCNPVN